MIFFTAVTEDNQSFKKMFQSEADQIWGISELSSTTFNNIQPLDYILFYCKGKIIAIGQVDKTRTDSKLSNKLFGTFTHQIKGEVSWANLIYFRNLLSVSLSFQFFQDICDYSSKFAVRKIIPMSQVGLQYVRMNFDSEELFINQIKNGLQHRL